MEKLTKFNNVKLNSYYLEKISNNHFDEKEINFFKKNLNEISKSFQFDFKILKEITGISQEALEILYNNDFLIDILKICDSNKLEVFLLNEFKKYCKQHKIAYSEL